MGLTFVDARVSSLANGRHQPVRFLVDSGAAVSMLPGKMLERLGVPKLWKESLRLADGRRLRCWIGEARVHLGRRVCPTLIAFGPDRAPALLGCVVLESLGLGIDPKRGRLRRTGKPLMMYALRIDPTPNPNALKVNVDRPLSEKPVTFSNAAAASGNALASALFAIAGVTSVFIFRNYITVTKSSDVEWGAIEDAIGQAVEKALQ